MGDVVEEGQTLCLIEAMKLFNELKADIDGRVRAIHVENAQPVEFDSSCSSRAHRRPAGRLEALRVFSRILVANRGEIAVRVIRALHELGWRRSPSTRPPTVTRSTSGSRTGGLPRAAPAAESYLRIPSVVAAAATTGCEAVHPGYGFLAENPAFARACVENDLVFVGPAPT